MCKIIKLINDLRIRYYELMMSICIDNCEYNKVEYGEDHKNCKHWVKRYEYYKNKLNKISTK